MKNAKRILEQYQAIFQDPAALSRKLRFGRGIVSISDIAQQYYCEKALELNYEHPLEQTDEMRDGAAGHETSTALAIPVSKEQAMRDAVRKRKKPICIYEFGITWNHMGVPILGRVDEVWFRGGNVDFVVERKFTDVLRPYGTYHVQARLYCLGLEEMGFKTSSTLYTIMTFKRSCFHCEMLALKSCNILTNERSHFSCDKGEAKTFTYPYNRDEAVKELSWALDYWLGRREAIPSKNPAKCRACRQRIRCEDSLT